jgi:hypothetical protein
MTKSFSAHRTYSFPLLVFKASGTSSSLDIFVNAGEHEEEHDDGDQRANDHRQGVSLSVVECKILARATPSDSSEPHEFEEAAQLDQRHYVGAAGTIVESGTSSWTRTRSNKNTQTRCHQHHPSIFYLAATQSKIPSRAIGSPARRHANGSRIMNPARARRTSYPLLTARGN